MPPVLGSNKSGVDHLNDKTIKLEGKPWKLETSDTSEGRSCDCERLQSAVIGTVTKLGYKLSMDITLDMATNTRVFFLIKTSSDDTGSLVTVPNNSGAGLGEKETLCVYRPLLVRHKSSFFRSYHGKSESFRKKLRSSLRKKVMSRNEKRSISDDPLTEEKTKLSEPAWWQQVSTDCGDNY